MKIHLIGTRSEIGWFYEKLEALEANNEITIWRVSGYYNVSTSPKEEGVTVEID